MDRPRYGLINHSSDLAKLLADDTEIELLHVSESENFLIFGYRCLKNLLNTRNSVILVWNLGIFFMFAPLLRFWGHTIIYTFHEPSDLTARFQKSGRFLKAVVEHFLVEYYSLLFNWRVLFNDNFSRRKILDVVPLPFRTNFVTAKSSTVFLVYMGTQLTSRNYEKFKLLSAILTKENIICVEFPSAAFGRTEDQKVRCLERGNAIIWNHFNIEYNQSGVSVDALKYGVPIIVSEFEKNLDMRSGGVNIINSNSDISDYLTAIRAISAQYNDQKNDLVELSLKCEQHARTAWRMCLSKIT